MTDEHSTVSLLSTDASDLRFQDALCDLFGADGTIYLVSGYFTYQGYRCLRDDIADFIRRSPTNRLIVLVGPASDQFSPRIATDLWTLDTNGQVELYKCPRCLHAKLYLRTGDTPRCIVGSGNITQVAFQYNVELNLAFSRPSDDHPDISQIQEWVDELVADSDPLRRRDLFAPILLLTSFINWSNKAMLLPTRNVVLRVIPVLIMVILFTSVARIL